MQLTHFINAALLLAGVTVEAVPLVKTTTPFTTSSNVTLEQIAENALTVAKARTVTNSTNGCTADKLSVRKYW